MNDKHERLDTRAVLDEREVLDARARRRRMHRRLRKRRLTRVFVSAAALFVGALTLTPKPQRAIDTAASRTLFRRAPSDQLVIEPFWRRAVDVLKRPKNQPAAALPFGLDPSIVHGELLGRWHRVYTYATRYRIAPELSRKIYDAAVTAGIEPELGFRLVRVESVFNPRAQSPSGALGLTQLMPGTARGFEPSVTREQLLDADINMRIGFRYLRALIREYGSLKLALLVYNRGPVAVQNAKAQGNDPTNGYETMVMRGYRGRGTLN